LGLGIAKSLAGAGACIALVDCNPTVADQIADPIFADSAIARAALRERKLEIQDERATESFKFRDPDGFLVQVNRSDYVGHVS
jgi:hypothetical protein